MIKLKLHFGKDQDSISLPIEAGELLRDAITRALKDVPKSGFEEKEMFVATVNGVFIESDFWPVTQLRESDTVIISPRIRGGDSSVFFRQALIITIAVVASVIVGPAAGGGFVGALAAAGTTIAGSLLVNALIPLPVPDLGPGFGTSVNDSQMYSINGQSNQMRRLGTVPKVYGNHRMFPYLAANPYTELSVDPLTGETTQYLYAIYDFGMGTYQLSDLKIGDTPLSTDSFSDFNVNLVDINVPSEPQDSFDEGLQKEFSYYKGQRTALPLSLALVNGSEFTQFTDVNPEGLEAEIILDFIAPRGLFSFASNGVPYERTVKMLIEFAKVGTDDWRAYNDLNYVKTFSGVAGGGGYDFRARFRPPVNLDAVNNYYEYDDWIVGGKARERTENRIYYIKPGTNRLFLNISSDEDYADFQVGYRVFYGNRYLGRVLTVNSFFEPGGKIPSYVELILDQVITTKRDIVAFETSQPQFYISDPPLIPPDYYPGTITTKNFRFIISGPTENAAAYFKAKSTQPVYSHYRFTPIEPAQYKVRVTRVSTSTFVNSPVQSADDVTWIALTTAFNSTPIKTDKRHLFLELRIKATNQLNGNIQNLSGVLSAAIPVYDSNTGTWSRQLTDNPAWVFCDLLTGEVNRRAIDKSKLHLPSIIEWAEFCEEVPDSPTGITFLDPRFTCNFILDYEATLQTVINQITNAAQASLNIIDGKYGVLIDRRKDTPIQIFTPRNSSNFSSTRAYSPKPDGVKIKFVDPNLDWEINEAIVYDNGFTELNATNFDELTAFACTNYDQAWRFGRYMIAQNKLRQETINIQVDFENLICTRGDYVQITQDVMRVGGTPARVKEVAGNQIRIDDAVDISPSINYGYVYRSSETGSIQTSTLVPLTPRTFELLGEVPDVGDLIVIGEVGKIVYDCLVKSISPNDDLSATVTLIEKADAIYDYESTDVIPDYDPEISNTSSPDFYPPLAVTGLSVAQNTWECSPTLSGYNYYINLAWDIPGGSVYEFFEVWVNDGRGYRSYDRTTNRFYKYDVDQSRLGIQHGFKIVAVSASGKKLELINMPEVLATPNVKSTPPADVEDFNINITNQVLQLAWTLNDDCDIAYYQLRFSPDTNDIWETSIPLATLNKDVNSTSVQARTGSYFIKAFDFAGNQSANSAVAITTIPNLFDLNIIETINDAPTFDGVLETTDKLGQAVILQQEVTGDPLSDRFYPEGYYVSNNLLDLDDVFTARLQSLIRADGYKLGELMSNWNQLLSVDDLSTSSTDDWDVSAEYRASDIFAAMADWERLELVDSINFGAGVGFTEWRQIPTTGDATGRIFQFRIRLNSYTPNVTPRLFDSTVQVDMPDRIDSFENLTSHPTLATIVTYAQVFKGPGTTPNVQISLDNGETGDYWVFDYKTLQGFAIRFYNRFNVQVERQFDVVAKGYGRRHTTTI